MLYYCIFAVYSSFIISQLNYPHLSNSYYQIINLRKGPTLQCSHKLVIIYVLYIYNVQDVF